jgi:aryl-alcohol dehydrogenase-like predicted oxidoreductase
MNRTPERELLPMARAFDIGVTAWGALGSGILTGKYNKNASVSGRAAIEKRLNERGLGIAKELVALSEEIGHTPSQIALNWVRQQPGVMIPLIGARTLKQFQDNIGCLEFTLTEKQMQRLHEVSKIEMGYPHEFLAQENVIKYVYGGVFSRIDNHRR